MLVEYVEVTTQPVQAVTAFQNLVNTTTIVVFAEAQERHVSQPLSTMTARNATVQVAMVLLAQNVQIHAVISMDMDQVTWIS
jgi:hypothetical protein